MRCDAEWARKHEGTMAGDGHDWVLVAPRAWTPESGSVVDKLLWACPCDAVKWTSYAEGGGRRGGGP